jgi:hypothetical protein
LEKKSKKEKKKTTKEEQEDKDAADYKDRLELQCKITKINQLIPKRWMATATSEKFLTTIGARLRTESQETTTGVFCADALIIV